MNLTDTLEPLVTLDAARLAEDGDTVIFTYTDAFGRERSGLVYRRGDTLKAWHNMCPHWATTLEDEDGQLWDESGCYIQCAQHGALFDPDDGACIFGPPEGARLEPLVARPSDDGAEVLVLRAALTLSF